MRLTRIMCCAAVIAAAAAPAAHADEWNKKTYLTFSGPVQIPGTTLPAGTYTFQLADLESNRHVVQILDKESGKLIATFLTVPDYKLDASDKNVVMFEERPSGMPAAIKAWFYPGDTTGDEFVYPKSQALKIAKETHSSVLSMNDDTTGTTTDSMKGAKVGRVNENGEAVNDSGKPTQPAAGTTASGSTATTAATGTTTAGTTGTSASAAGANATRPTTGTTATTAQSTTAPRATTAPRTSSVGTSGQAEANAGNDTTVKKSRKQLPRTGSELALFELLSAASFAGVFGLRQLRKRISGNA
jgi:hypothetical protein